MKKVKNLLLIPALLLCFTLKVSAQRASEAPEAYVKGESANAITIVLTGQPKNVEAVVDNKIQAGTGKKSKPLKGNRAFEGVQYPALSSATLDIYFRVEPAAKGTDNSSKVIVFLSAGQSNFLSSREYPQEITRMYTFLEELPLEVRKYELQLAIDEQQKQVDRDIKDHEKMVRDSVALQKTLAETVKAIDDNKAARDGQLQKIEEAKQKKIDLEQALKDMSNPAWAPDQNKSEAEKKED